jgi:putative hydrolase of the HAD superfamily
LQALIELRSNYRIFLLSNTNSIHLEAFSKSFREVSNGKAFNDYFDKAYYSNEIGLRKPDPESYQLVIDENNLVAEHTLFIDDTVPNIAGANKVGLQTHLLLPGENIESLNL